MRKRNLLTAMALTVAMTAALAGCSASSSSDVAQTTTAAQQETTAATTTEAPKDDETKGEDATTEADNDVTTEEKAPEKNPETMSEFIVEDVKKAIADGKDMAGLGDAVVEGKAGEEYGLMSMSIADVADYMPGFDTAVTKYTDGVVVAPMIGTIPMIVYVFETDDAEGLMAEIDANSNPRWNICTEAHDISKVSVDDKYVVFAMCPGDEEGGEIELPEIPAELQ